MQTCCRHRTIWRAHHHLVSYRYRGKGRDADSSKGRLTRFECPIEATTVSSAPLTLFEEASWFIYLGIVRVHKSHSVTPKVDTRKEEYTQVSNTIHWTSCAQQWIPYTYPQEIPRSDKTTCPHDPPRLPERQNQNPPQVTHSSKTPPFHHETRHGCGL
jgi:hypothetical protein